MSGTYRVAVYGTLKEGCGNDGLLRNAKHLGNEILLGPYYMWHLGGFPAVSVHGHDDNELVIEVYEVDRDTLDDLNNLEGYDPDDYYHGFYDRQSVDTCYGPAFIYTMQYHDCVGRYSLIDGGCWERHSSKYA